MVVCDESKSKRPRLADLISYSIIEQSAERYDSLNGDPVRGMVSENDVISVIRYKDDLIPEDHRYWIDGQKDYLDEIRKNYKLKHGM